VSRNPLHESRKWALYYIANLLFKTYFKLNQISLSKNILRSLRAAGSDMPPLSAFPKAHQTTFKYYCGVIHFLEEDYTAAEEYLTSAYDMCLAMRSATGASKHQMLILTYLIPTRLLTSHKLPSKTLLAPYPRLAALFGPLAAAIRTGDLAAFTEAMEQGEDEFVKRRIYLTLERGRDIILRNIFRKVFIAGGFEGLKEGGGENGTPQGGTPSGVPAPAAVRRTRVPVREFAAALLLAGAEVGDGEGGIDGDEVECLIANAIYKVRLRLQVHVKRPVLACRRCSPRSLRPPPICGCRQPFATAPL
jgi:COP9 signalosome complex subunit 12